MQSAHDFQLYLFDFDGVLVDTEALHLKAYQRMCANRGFEFSCDMHHYAQVALFRASGLKDLIYQKLPGLYQQEPNWDVLYQEKKQCYLQLLEEEGAQFMPGVEPLLEYLDDLGVNRCVVTHSPLEQIETIKQAQPLLKTIPHWITRECYSEPKPHPECYQLAVKQLAKPGQAIVGFEDSPRGMSALLHTSATAYLVTSFLTAEQIADFKDKALRPFHHLSSMVDYLHQAQAACGGSKAS